MPSRLEDAVPVQSSKVRLNEQCLIIGDTHASAGALLNYARVYNLIEMTHESAVRLGRIAQSTSIDRLEEVYRDIQNYKSKPPHLSTPFMRVSLSLAEREYERLKNQIQQEHLEFDEELSKIQHSPDAENRGILSSGDNTGDRNRSERDAIETLDFLDIPEIYSNHGAELLYAIVTDSWDNLDANYLIPTFQTRSLRNFKILLKHGLVTPEEKDKLMKSWLKRLHLMMFSVSELENGTRDATFYIHAPGGLKRILDLAWIYGIQTEIDKLDLDKTIELSLEIMSRFKASIDKLSSDCPETVMQGKTEIRNTLEAAKNVSHPFFALSNTRLKDYVAKGQKPLSEAEIDAKLLGILNENERKKGRTANIIFSHGHDLGARIWPKPAHLVGIDNQYWKPLEPCLSKCYNISAKPNGWKTTEEWIALKADSMEQNAFYLSESSEAGVIQYCLQSTESVNFPDIRDDNGKFLGWDFDSGYLSTHQPEYVSGAIHPKDWFKVYYVKDKQSIPINWPKEQRTCYVFNNENNSGESEKIAVIRIDDNILMCKFNNNKMFSSGESMVQETNNAYIWEIISHIINDTTFPIYKVLNANNDTRPIYGQSKTHILLEQCMSESRERVTVALEEYDGSGRIMQDVSVLTTSQTFPSYYPETGYFYQKIQAARADSASSAPAQNEVLINPANIPGTVLCAPRPGKSNTAKFASCAPVDHKSVFN